MLPTTAATGWSADRMWGISMIAVSVTMHAAGLALMGVGLAKAFGAILNAPLRIHHRFILFSVMVGVAAVLLALLHGLEASCWAAIYVWLGACPDSREAIYFSLQMATTLGADVVQLETSLEADGSAGGDQRDAAVRAEHCVSVRGHTACLAVRHGQPLTIVSIICNRHRLTPSPRAATADIVKPLVFCRRRADPPLHEQATTLCRPMRGREAVVIAASAP